MQKKNLHRKKGISYQLRTKALGQMLLFHSRYCNKKSTIQAQYIKRSVLNFRSQKIVRFLPLLPSIFDRINSSQLFFFSWNSSLKIDGTSLFIFFFVKEPKEDSMTIIKKHFHQKMMKVIHINNRATVCQPVTWLVNIYSIV